MDKINVDLESRKNKLTAQNVIVGNSTQAIKQILEMIYNIENKIMEIYDKFDSDIKDIKLDINTLKEVEK